MELQLRELFPCLNQLQSKYGDESLMPIYGAGCTRKPNLFFVFINPTGRNVSSAKKWPGIRAPWLGTKNIWKLFFKLNLINTKLFSLTQTLKSHEWTPEICLQIYKTLATKKVYVTNLAKCTLSDARPIQNRIFKEYLKLIEEEILAIRPRRIITFGNQVSSILLRKSIRVSKHNGLPQKYKLKDMIFIVYPVYYPVGQGMRNISQAVEAINKILKRELVMGFRAR